MWKTVPGSEVTVQVMRGLPEVFLPAWAADWNTYIEPLRDADSASYTPTNSVDTSNHLNGTAEDLNWDDHPFLKDSFSDEKKATVHEMVDFYEGWMFWAGDWEDPLDQMHSQMGYNTWSRNTAALDFISRKIRSDGFSTFRRGPLNDNDPLNPGEQPAAPTPDTPANPSRGGQQPTDSPAQVLYDAVPTINETRAAQLADRIVAGLALAQCNTPMRIAMWLAQIGHESDGFNATEEYQKDGPGWSDERRIFLGRSWIQITWRRNYRGFSMWCFDRELVPTENYFVQFPAELADDKWAAIGPAWYWTVARPQINGLCDAGNLREVTRVINGGYNGIDDRQQRYDQALALGDRLLTLINPPTNAGGPLMALTDDEQTELLQKTREIWDQLRGPAGQGWPQLDNLTPVDAIAETRNHLKDIAAGATVVVNEALTAVRQNTSLAETPKTL